MMQQILSVLLGFYLIMLGASSVRDGFFYEKQSQVEAQNETDTAYICDTALIPINTLRKWNETLATPSNEESQVHSERKNENQLI